MGHVGVIRSFATWVFLCCAFTVACDERESADDDEDDHPRDGNGATRGERCVAFCDRLLAAACTSFDHAGCTSQCADTEALVADSGRCGGEFDTYLACVSVRPDICDAVLLPTPDPCEEQSLGYIECHLDYCDTNPSKTYCPGV
jgi:hypothetical protein